MARTVTRVRIRGAALSGLALLCALPFSGSLGARPPGVTREPTREILPNDNRTPAGVLRDGRLHLHLVAGSGEWFPERDVGPGQSVYAFGVGGGALTNPGPLIRVPAGIAARVVVRNDIPGKTLTVHGLHDRPGRAEPLVLAPGAEEQVDLRLTMPGTYHYWATTRGARSLTDRFGPESQLHGALIVDPAGGSPVDRVFVIGIADDSAALPADRPLRAAVVNGLSWPHTEVATVGLGDTVRMRWINATDRRHPMHLHGFYFQVESRGDGTVDTVYTPQQRRLAVTELMNQGGTFTLSWVPDRPGNWLMHCHMAEHVSHELRQGGRGAAAEEGHAHNHALQAMSGLVIGWTVLSAGADDERNGAASGGNPRRLRLVASPTGHAHGEVPGLGFALRGTGVDAPDTATIPGPPLVLVRGEPVVVRVVNALDEPTSIHWHGIELDSYFDGVSGWSGAPGRTAPHIEPGDSFDVAFTPPRAGTFIYHSHFAEGHQLAAGLFGPLIVLAPGQHVDARRDHTWVLSQGGPKVGPPLLFNASTTPVLALTAGVPHRIRLINIAPNIPITFRLERDADPVQWRPIAKDGADLPPHQAASLQPAALRIGVGETYDFELPPQAPTTLRIRLLDPPGRVRLTGTVEVRP